MTNEVFILRCVKENDGELWEDYERHAIVLGIFPDRSSAWEAMDNIDLKSLTGTYDCDVEDVRDELHRELVITRRDDYGMWFGHFEITVEKVELGKIYYFMNGVLI